MKIFAITLIVSLLCMVPFFPVQQAEAFEIEGSFSWLPIAGSLTAGTSIPIVPTLKEDPVTGFDKVLNAMSIKISADYVLDEEQFKEDLIPDYAGPKIGIDIVKLLTNNGLKVNEYISFGIDAGALLDVQRILDKPSVIKVEPAIGLVLNIKFP